MASVFTVTLAGSGEQEEILIDVTDRDSLDYFKVNSGCLEFYSRNQFTIYAPGTWTLVTSKEVQAGAW
jgi:hypothetical protein